MREDCGALRQQSDGSYVLDGNFNTPDFLKKKVLSYLEYRNIPYTLGSTDAIPGSEFFEKKGPSSISVRFPSNLLNTEAPEERALVKTVKGQSETEGFFAAVLDAVRKNLAHAGPRPR